MNHHAPHPSHHSIPARAGVGLKPAHYRDILATRPDVGFFEVHAENYMGAGGPPHRYLAQLRRHYALSVHGVGLSIGAARPLDAAHLGRLASLVRRYQPALVSEHLAWSSHGGAFFNDLLPVPYHAETLAWVCGHIHQVQEALGQELLLENPATYVAFGESTWSEPDFIAEVTRRTGCGLLLDVNNVIVACTNQLWQPLRYIDAFPLHAVRQLHLAGHATDADASGRPLLIDTHDRPVSQAVWDLYARVIDRIGRRPTLIEWDQHLPSWETLHREAQRAESILTAFDAAAGAPHAAAR